MMLNEENFLFHHYARIPWHRMRNAMKKDAENCIFYLLSIDFPILMFVVIHITKELFAYKDMLLLFPVFLHHLICHFSYLSVSDSRYNYRKTIRNVILLVLVPPLYVQLNPRFERIQGFDWMYSNLNEIPCSLQAIQTSKRALFPMEMYGFDWSASILWAD